MLYNAGIGPVLANNIVVSSGGDNYAIGGSYSWGGFHESDYNDLYTTAGASVGYAYIEDRVFINTLAEWINRTDLDLHSMGVDPSLADILSGDLHLLSTEGRWDAAANSGTGEWVTDSVDSPCMDAGDPASDVGAETAPNGARINMGAYGGTTPCREQIRDA